MPERAFVFDAYGTLFDVHSAVWRHASRIGSEALPFSELWRAKQLEYSWVRALMGHYRDFWQLTGEALDFALAKFPGVDPGLRQDLLDAYRTIAPFPEVPEVIGRLRERGGRLAILSNGTPRMLADAVAAAGLGGMFEKVLSVDAVQTYKTHGEAYRLATRELGLEPGQVTFCSSNRWDVAGACRFGFQTVWVNRTGQPDEYRDAEPAKTVGSLAGLA